MSAKTKITLIIILTFLIGIITGAMLNRALLRHYIRKTLMRRNPSNFISFYERVIGPNEKQRKLIRKILSKHAKNISEINEKFREELQSAHESLYNELDAVLTPEQKKRFEKALPPPPKPPRFLRRGFEKTAIEDELNFLKENLNLTENQVMEIKKILINYMNKIKKFRRKQGGFRWRFSYFKKLEEEKNKAIERILNEEQKKKFIELKNKRKLTPFFP